jgi:hypothetical protein
VSGTNQWEYGHYWKLRPGVDRKRTELPVDWERLQRPGFSPDYIDGQLERMDLAFERDDWIPTVAAQALIRNNRPLLACIGGKEKSFTARDHQFHPGDIVEKQTIVLNNSRETVTCNTEWTLKLPQPLRGSREITVATGQRENVPLHFELPPDLPPASYEIALKAAFSTGEIQEDRFTIDVMPRVTLDLKNVRVAVFDPRGEMTKLLESCGIRSRRIDAGGDVSNCDLLIVGKAALAAGGAAPDITRAAGAPSQRSVLPSANG